MAGVVRDYSAGGRLSDVRRRALISLARKIKARDRAEMIAAIGKGIMG